MACEDHLEASSAYDDGALGAEETARLEAHLETCAACRRRLAEYRALHALLGAEKDVEPGPGFLDGVRRRVRAGGTASPPVRRRVFTGMAAAAAVTLLVLGLVFFGRRKDLSGPPPPAGDAAAVPGFSEVERAVEADPELLEILENLEALDRIEMLEHLPLLERMDEMEVKAADELAEAAEGLVVDSDLPLDAGVDD